MKIDQVMGVIFLVVAGGILAYVVIDCIITIVDNPIGTNTTLRTSVERLCLSICLYQYTSIYSLERLKDVANTTDFWMKGNNLSNKIAELSFKSSDGKQVTIWNRSIESSKNLSQSKMFQIVHFINSNTSVNFCHTLKLSAMPFRTRKAMIRAVNDITLVVHLTGQLIRSQSYYTESLM